MKEYLNNKTAHVYYDETLDTLFLEYVGKVLNDEQFIAINTEVLNAFKSLNTQKFVADIRKMGIISVGSQEWVLKNLLPGMIKHLKGKKLFHAQLLDPSEVMAKVSGANIKNKAKTVADDFEVIQFTNESEMKDYLRNFKASS
jgi:hypothetical protein